MVKVKYIPEDISSKKQVKSMDKSLLLNLLTYLDGYGDRVSYIRDKLKMSKQLTHYYLKRLKQANLIKQTQSHPYSIYSLTTFGHQVKDNLIHNEDGTKSKTLWDVHNFVVRFPIYEYGNYSFNENKHRKMVRMNNWGYIDEIDGEFIIRVQDNGLMRIFCPRRTTKNPEQEFIKLGSEAQNLAQKLCNRFDMKLGLMQISRKGHKTLKKSEQIAKVLGKFRAGNIWTDDSTGNGDEVEELQDSTQIEQILAMPQQLMALMEAHNKLAVNLELHIKVLQEIRDGIAEFKQAVKEMKK